MNRVRSLRSVLLLLVMAAVVAACAGPLAKGGRGSLVSTAKPVNGHCEDPVRARQLRELGPVYAIGASVSHGLFATSFPTWIKRQLCLQDDEFEEDYFFLVFLKSDARILRHLSQLRPRIIVALDFPYHYVKMMPAERAKPILRHYLSMLLMDCRNAAIDCGERGAFHFVRREGFQPIVLTGDIYFDCAEDERVDPTLRSFPTLAECREENRKLNHYLYEMKKEYPNLHVLPVYDMITTLHDPEKGVYHYRVDGVSVDFTKADLFVDGFHPWTNPGTYVLANLVIDWMNKRVVQAINGGSVTIPYIPLAF
ncbi:MAG: hypothetical protein Kow006_06600 [Gammaproteobacteria bacterium]